MRPDPGSFFPFSTSVSEVARHLETDSHHGLTSEEATRRLASDGPNELTESPVTPAWRRFLSQFEEPVVLILIGAAMISGVLATFSGEIGEWIDTIAIIAIVLLNGILGYLQEQRAERALEALSKLSAPTARVTRDGRLQVIPARDLVPGDRIELEAGDHVPADARLIRGFEVRVIESALTGESVPVEKDARVSVPPDAALGDRVNTVYMSTIVATGRGSALVVATGMGTELGRIAGMLQRTQTEPTPLQRRLAELGKVLLVVVLLAVVLIFALQVARGERLLDAFLISVGLAVAAVPEGLPAVVTLALAIGLQRMVKRNALVRRLPSVETLGSVTVICSDKTGTLTRNEMTVREILTPSRHYHLTGVGYTPDGHFLIREEGVEPTERVDPDQAPDLQELLTAAVWCNNAELRHPTADDHGSEWRIIGDPTEGALVVAAHKGRVPSRSGGHELLHEIPFDSDRKAMSVVIRRADDTLMMFTKGAPEVVLELCGSEWSPGGPMPLDPARREALRQANAGMARHALRVLALAERPVASAEPADADERDLVFLGLAGMIDPPRLEVKEAVERCRGAGIVPVMITGDHPATAKAIAHELGIAGEDDTVLTGPQLESLSDAELVDAVEHTSVYARVSAEHKLRIVRAWRERGHVVAMTGDGVNDAPAVRAADIGIAMGITGTDVTKEASDMVLTDDNFASIVNAVEEGRGIFDNIQKFVNYLLSCNTGEVGIMLVAALAGWPTPLTAIQLLWINLVTDGLPALALGVEPAEKGTMRRPPRPPREPVISRQRGLLMLYHGTLISLASIAAFLLVGRGDPARIVEARAAAFGTMAYSQLFFALGCRSITRTLPELGFFTNPYLLGAILISGLLQLMAMQVPLLARFFGSHPLSGAELSVVLLISLAPISIIELMKLIRAWLRRG